MSTIFSAGRKLHSRRLAQLQSEQPAQEYDMDIMVAV